jgi:hypothetical protein
MCLGNGSISYTRISMGGYRFFESVDFWLGHENPDISDESAEQLLEDIERRQEVAAKVGLGFEIPKPSFVPNVPKTPELAEIAVAA